MDGQAITGCWFEMRCFVDGGVELHKSRVQSRAEAADFAVGLLGEGDLNATWRFLSATGNDGRNER